MTEKKSKPAAIEPTAARGLLSKMWGNAMKTVAEWLEKHPGVKARMFERNYKKESGSGKFEAVCGFCLASHYFRNKLRKNCRFCLAPFREGRSISRLPEILRQRWRIIVA